MKYAIVIADGAADFALDDLGGQTPFEAAHKPATDRISIEGCQGTVATTPAGMACGSDVCSMSLLGYDPRKYHSGRAPLEAEALGLELAESDWVFRVNLVTIADGRMLDHSAGHLSSEEGRALIHDLALTLDSPAPGTHADPAVNLLPGVSYRNLLVDRSGSRDWSGLTTTPPHDIPGEPIGPHLPTGAGGQWLRHLIERSASVFADHPVNRHRRERGMRPATHVWPWGQGRRIAIESFEQRFGLCGAMITAVDLLAGLAGFIGWDRLNVPGQTSYHDTDYAEAGRGAVRALDDHDLVCVHVESPDEAAHDGDAATKVAAIEAIDKHIVAPLRDALAGSGDGYRLLYLPDHYTRVASRKHDPTPVPFAMCGHKIAKAGGVSFTEANASEPAPHFTDGHDLMPYFLFNRL